MKLGKMFCQDRQGVMLWFLLLLIPMLFWLWSLTINGTEAKYVANRSKNSLNRAVKSAVLAIDTAELAGGQIRINETASRHNFDQILQINLNLNLDYTPASNSPLLEAPQILDYYIYQGSSFPYSYHSVLGIAYVFHDPGVLAVMKVKYKYSFTGRIQEIYVYAAAEAKR